ncbi:response regulator transcription factor [Fusobacterium perfoetens]|uniref:response regulator transcription factor n=1 Tax=Fusobacterium perfoetens TaxID=852 RepID=UPI00048412F8|nr:response regulator transcription factor [Fusobacterium perfoetens]MCI6152540.1 response regulator transcription factor [Fusobacterium perfoetens]
MKKILIIEDDKKIRRLLELELEHEGYLVESYEEGEKAIEKFKNSFFDVILLDLMLPNLSGEEICKIIRKISEIPIIVITAKDSIISKVELLDMGADDYITKPFNIEELCARIRVVLRNKKNYNTKDILRYGNLSLNTSLKVLKRNDEEISLTKTEYKLLEIFFLNKEIGLSREKIIEEVWGFDFDGDNKIVDVFINSLRKKIDLENEKYISSMRGFGYIFKLKN